MTTILIADDHAIFRQGLIRLLESSDEYDIVAEVDNGSDAWEQIRTRKIDIAILDIDMPELTGIQIAGKVMDEKLQTSVILLSMHDEPALITSALRVNVAGYVLKDDTFEDLLLAVQTVESGKPFFSHSVQDKIHSFDEMPVLSVREREVLVQIAKGVTNKDIAQNLGLSPKTVDTYRLRLMTKLNLHNVAELTRFAVKAGLIS